MTPRNRPVSLLVLSGLHEGASQLLEQPSLRIGGGGEADLVLADPSLAPVHLELVVADGFVNLTALHDGVEIDGLGALDAGRSRQLPLPARFAVMGVQLCCDGPPPHHRMTGLRWVLAVVAMLLALCVLPGTGVLRENGRGLQAHAAASRAVAGSRRDAPASNPTVAMPAAAAMALVARTGVARTGDGRTGDGRVGDGRPLRPLAAAQAAQMLRGLAAAAGMADITVTSSDDVVLATGQIPPTAAAAWQGVCEGFDRRTGGRVMLSNAVRVHVSQPFSLALDSVWTGNFPNIVVGGAKYLEGGVLPNGWTLDRIERDRLMLHRDGAQIEVGF